MTHDALSKVILDSAFRIHSVLGPGLFENVYEVIMAHELRKQHLQVARQPKQAYPSHSKLDSSRHKEPKPGQGCQDNAVRQSRYTGLFKNVPFLVFQT